MHPGHSIDCGNLHKLTVAPEAGRVRVYSSKGGQLHAPRSFLTAAAAREAAALLLAIADELEPPATTAVGVSTLGSPTSRAELRVELPKEG
jgi:hypothetical protein